jgi:hypothetical protein
MSDGCRNAAPLIDELIDGTLDDARARAVHAHLRSCADCNRKYTETQAIVEAAGSLEPVDPPPALWARVSERLDGEDATEHKRPGWWWWWQAWRRSLLFAGVGVAAAALALVVVLRDRPTAEHAEPEAPPRTTEVVPPPVFAGTHGPATDDLYTAALEEVQRADARYEHALTELRDIVKVERANWKPEQARAFDENLAAIDAAVERQRDAVRREPGNVLAVDALHASYRKEIDFLQEAVVRGEAVEL